MELKGLWWVVWKVSFVVMAAFALPIILLYHHPYSESHFKQSTHWNKFDLSMKIYCTWLDLVQFGIIGRLQKIYFCNSCEQSTTLLKTFTWFLFVPISKAVFWFFLIIKPYFWAKFLLHFFYYICRYFFRFLSSECEMEAFIDDRLWRGYNLAWRCSKDANDAFDFTNSPYNLEGRIWEVKQPCNFHVQFTC